MNFNYEIILEGSPIAKKRPMVVRRGDKTWATDCQSHEKELVKFQLRQNYPKLCENPIPKNVPLILNFEFHLSGSPKIKNIIEWGMLHHLQKPDISNLIKFYEDVFNGILYHDDSQIVEINFSSKKFSFKPKTIIRIMTLPNNQFSESEKKILNTFSQVELRDFLNSCKHLVNNYLDASETLMSEEEIKMMIKSLSVFSSQHADKLKKIKKFNISS